MTGNDYYSVLGVRRDAAQAEIRAAYQSLKTQAGDALASDQWQRVEAAYATLNDPIRRLRYDAQAAAPPPPRFEGPSLSLPRGLRKLSLPDRSRLLPIGLAAAAVVAAVVLVLFFSGGRHSGDGQTGTESAQPDAGSAAERSVAKPPAAGASAGRSPAPAPFFIPGLLQRVGSAPSQPPAPAVTGSNATIQNAAVPQRAVAPPAAAARPVAPAPAIAARPAAPAPAVAAGQSIPAPAAPAGPNVAAAAAAPPTPSVPVQAVTQPGPPAGAAPVLLGPRNRIFVPTWPVNVSGALPPQGANQFTAPAGAPR